MQEQIRCSTRQVEAYREQCDLREVEMARMQEACDCQVGRLLEQEQRHSGHQQRVNQELMMMHGEGRRFAPPHLHPLLTRNTKILTKIYQFLTNTTKVPPSRNIHQNT